MTLLDDVQQNINNSALRNLFAADINKSSTTAMATDSDVVSFDVEKKNELKIGLPVMYRTNNSTSSPHITLTVVGHINKNKSVVLYKNYSKTLHDIINKLVGVGNNINEYELVSQPGYYIITRMVK